ncbi:MAG: polynucleotide kinase-phosphatase [Acidimicrobiales bacterium]
MTTIKIPDLCLVVLIGVSGSGKSSFARRHFGTTEVVSSDSCRALVSDDENDQTATGAAFAVLHSIASERLKLGKLTVIDATNVHRDARAPLLALAREHHVFAMAVVLDVPPEICQERNAARPDRDFGPHVVRNQRSALQRSMKALEKEGFRKVFRLTGVEQIEAAAIERERRWTDKRDLLGPFDVIGDVHGCLDELVDLLMTLGYEVNTDRTSAHHPEGRTAVFVGDLVDRGPAVAGVLRLVMTMVEQGDALCVPGNHEIKLVRALNGRNVTLSHGLAESIEQLKNEPPEFVDSARQFMDRLVSHAVLDEGRLVVAHAGLREEMHNRTSGVVRSFSLFGDTTGETDEYGFPVRYPWAEEYRGTAAVVYGHTPVPEAVWLNNTICVDTGCVFGGKLTALRWPERDTVSVPALREYWEPVRPLVEPATAREARDLTITDVAGTLLIETRLGRTITIREENSAAALEVMSRFAVDPRWLVYLPPTMSPCATSDRPGILEHPDQAFAYYRKEGVTSLVCEEKHMGSRAVVVVCRDAAAAAARFGVPDDSAGGVIVTRTGRRFFSDEAIESALLDRMRNAIASAGLWDELATDWLVLDAELLPWSAKAGELLTRQYAPTGAAATASVPVAEQLLGQAAERGIEVDELLTRTALRSEMVTAYRDAYRQYCWTVDGVDDLAIAPFQVLAAEGEVHALRPHAWHLEMADRLVAAGADVFRRTERRMVDLDDEASVEAGVDWWTRLTATGGEGMVVKPADTIVETGRGVTQPGVKCRGPEYLRIIYGPEYTTPENLDRLRQRGLGHKRALAAREFALGIESLERFVAREPLYRVHECVFGVLALESEPVDPTL